MNLIQKIFLAAFCFIIVVMNVNAQGINTPDYDKCADFFKNNPLEKIYLHTDRDVYAENDTIWFKIYLVNAHTLKLDHDVLRNVYVELVNSDQKVVVRNMLAIQNGVSFGDFNIRGNQIGKGKYKLRAYTRYQTNFGTNFLFEKNILITSVFGEQSYQAYFDSISNLEYQEQAKNSDIDLQFMPEGGELTHGIINNLAFKALNSNGFGVDVSGIIYDNNGNRITNFKSEYLGMGKTTFKPELNQSYYALIGQSSHKYILPTATNRLMMNVSDNDSLLIIRLKTNALNVSPVRYHLVVSSRGLVWYYSNVTVNSAFKTIKIPHAELAFGVNQITLLDSSLTPIRDRLVFIDNQNNIDAEITTDQKVYNMRDSVVVDIHVKNMNNTSVKAFLSVAVTDQKLTQTLEKYPQNIQTYLLLCSDIQGNIENPAYYFQSNNEDAPRHLDLLMMTQGWSQYHWNSILRNPLEIKLPKQYGIELNGKVNQVFMGKALKNRRINMSMEQGDKIFYESITTDNEGKFNLTNLIIPDTTHVYFACPDQKNMNQKIEVQTFMPELPVMSFSDFRIPEGKNLKKFEEQSIIRYQEDKAYHPEAYDVLLNEVTINKIMNPVDIKDDHNRPYARADRVYAPGKDDDAYTNVLYYLSRELGKVRYNGETVYISGISKDNITPLMLLDGIEVEQFDLENLPMNVVDKVEVIVEPTSRMMWPSDSKAQLGGVISVFTKRFNKMDEYYSNNQLVKILRGYSSSKKFYSPRYYTENIKGIDRRTTLLWAPIINTDAAGTARFVFFNGDNASSIKIEVEGISIDGKPIVAEAVYQVKGK